jgi:hypothetical protein
MGRASQLVVVCAIGFAERSADVFVGPLRVRGNHPCGRHAAQSDSVNGGDA